MAAVFMSLFSVELRASESINVQITYVIANKEGYIFFGTGPKSAAPACDTLQRWAVKGDTTAGQILVSSVVSAYLSGKTVDVFGGGVCTIWAASENVDYIMIK